MKSQHPSLLALLALLAGCQAAPDRTLQDWAQAMSRADVDGAVACHAAGAVWLPPGAAPIDGTAAIAQQCREQNAAGAMSMRLSIEEQQIEGERALLRGTLQSQLTARDGSVVRREDRLSAVLRLEHGCWRIVQLAWQPTAAAR